MQTFSWRKSPQENICIYRFIIKNETDLWPSPPCCHFLHRYPYLPIVTGHDVAPVEAGRGNLREDPAGQAAWGKTAFKNDLVLHLTGDERTHNLIHWPNPGGAPCLDVRVKEAQGRAILVEGVSTAQRAARCDPHVHDSPAFQDPAEVPFSLDFSLCAIWSHVGNVNIPGTNKLPK